MKKITQITVALALLFAVMHAQAQSPVSDGKQNYIVMTKQIPQLEIILMTAEELEQKEGNTGDFQALICGKEVTELTDHQKMAPWIKRAKEAGVSLVVCGFSLNMFKVDRNQLPKEMKVVDNGLLHALTLQKKGYISVSL